MGLSSTTAANKMEIDSNTSNTSKKQKMFIDEPMGDKLVIEIGGIGKIASAKLAEIKITKAYHLLAYFLTLDKDNAKFITFLKEQANMTEKNARVSAETLDAWCQQFL